MTDAKWQAASDKIEALYNRTFGHLEEDVSDADFSDILAVGRDRLLDGGTDSEAVKEMRKARAQIAA